MADESGEHPDAVPGPAGASDKPVRRKVQRQPPSIKPKPKEKERGKPLESWKAWSETILSIVKTVTLVVVTAAIVLLVGSIVLRDRGQRQVTLEIDSKVEKLISDLGVDFDLRAALRDETNSRIQSVKSFLEASLFKNIDFGGSQAVSFKPFGVDMKTNDVTDLARLLLGGEPAFRARFELLCEKGPCDAPQSSSVSPPDRFKHLTLIVNVSGPDRHSRLNFPLSARPSALRRALRIAMQQTAEKLLELAEPMIASVLYSNGLGTTDFPDEMRRYAILTAGATFAVRSEASDRSCLSEIQLGDSLLQRGDFQSGMEKLDRIAEESKRRLTKLATTAQLDRARTCLIQAKTDQVYFLFWRLCDTFARNQTDADRLGLLQGATKDMKDLMGIVEGAPALEQIRVNEFFAYMKFIQILFENDMPGLASVCSNTKDRQRSASIIEARSGRIISAIEAFRTALPPRDPLRSSDTVLSSFLRYLDVLDVFPEPAPPKERLKMPALVLEMLLAYIDFALPSTEVAKRLGALAATVRMADEYVALNPAPGALYLLRGRILRSMAFTVRDARRRVANDAEKRSVVKAWRGKEGDAKENVNSVLEGELDWSLTQAKIAFENAAAAVSSPSWFERSPDMEATIYLGDIDYVDNSAAEAEKSYARALRLFIEQAAPIRDFKLMAKVATRWAIVRKRAGACRPKAARDPQWDEVWTLLGATSNHDWCPIVEPDKNLLNEKLGVLGIVSTLVRATVNQCGQTDPDDAVTDETREKLDLIECLEGADLSISRTFFSANSGSDIDRKISQALDARLDTQ